MNIEAKNEELVISLGEKLGRLLVGGEIIELVGDIGAGKTTFTKGVALGLGVDEYVQSPSFTINRVYDGRDGLKLSHYDFYRLNDAGIMSDEISEVIADSKTVTIIEWAEAVHGVLPKDRLKISISVLKNGYRNMHFESDSNKFSELIGKLVK